MPDLILHHYATSPFSEKVRLVLGLKKMAWRSVTVPVMLPKPDVIAVERDVEHADRHARTLDALDLIGEPPSEVVTAVDGQDAMDKVHQVQPDVITIDVKMPRMDGLDTVARLRADPRTAGLKIAMVTASAQEIDLRRGETAGVDAYVTKPFDPEALVRTIRDLVAREAS